VAIENGQLVYTPNAGYVGTDTFTYTVTSGGVNETAVTVTLTNMPGGRLAATTPKTLLVVTAASGLLLATDSEHDALTVSDFTVGSQTGRAPATLAGGELTINSDGSYRFTPVADWNGTAPR
jgi:pectate lyase